ncbi:LpqB family beta-propeller domain-containing protein [Cellulosimicrobium arenosum]|uniref:Lipoprotein LpqB beta-propeller domain-containing protein n=1 Tax=Cellulosimicrobium arenosum TaxID=2708133 RepID=A0A927PGF5_9MICO|nr:LpqB family beta-propeller domain-containing protein [Cellulosimicrobium arenosum]MBD8080718.1 hypothetical protein [Cellulosimicrobium arenosum]
MSHDRDRATSRTTARTGSPPTTRPVRRVVLAVVVVVCATVLGACAAIPTSGPVMEGEAVVAAPGPVFLQANSPRQDAPPDQIVQGFLAAQVSGATGTFDVATEFLTPASASSWSPLAQVAVLATEPTFDVDDSAADADTATVRATAELVGVVDARGVYTEQLPGSTTELVYELARDSDGQWRIETTDDGLAITRTNFDRTYRATDLYFPTADRRYLVPDERWFPGRNWQTLAVRETLAGPAEWLSGAVTTATPEGIGLSIDSVTVADTGPVVVPLTDAASAMSTTDRGMLVAQLEASLADPARPVVQLSVGSAPLAAGPTPDIGPAVTPDDPVVLVGDDVSTLEGRSTEPVEGVAPLAGLDPTALAFRGSSSGSTFVVRDGTDRLVTAPHDGSDSVVLLEGEGLLAPGIDRFGLVWSGPAVQGGSLEVVSLDGEVSATVPVPWLEERRAVSVRVAPDGARLAVVSTSGTSVRVDVAGVVRDESGLPVQVSDPVRVGQPVTSASQVMWTDTALLGVLGRTATDVSPRLQLVPVGGPTRQASPLEDADWLAAGPGVSSVLLGTGDRSLYSAGSSTLWTRVATDVVLPTYPG